MAIYIYIYTLFFLFPGGCNPRTPRIPGGFAPRTPCTLGAAPPNLCILGGCAPWTLRSGGRAGGLPVLPSSLPVSFSLLSPSLLLTLSLAPSLPPPDSSPLCGFHNCCVAGYAACMARAPLLLH